MPEFLSSNHFSVDQQLADVVDALTTEQRAAFLAEFPEWPNLVWSGSWVDAEASGVDIEFTSWAIDWIELHTNVYWEDGEPVRCLDCNDNADAPDCSACGTSNTGAREHPHYCEQCEC